MGEGYLFVALLAMTVAAVSLIVVQVVFSLFEVKKRRLQERLGGATDSSYESQFGPIALAEKPQDLTGMFARSAAVQSFHARLVRAYPGVVLSRFFLMIVGFALLAGMLAFLATTSPVAAVFVAAMAGMLPFLIVNARCAKQQRVIEDQLPEALDFLSRVLRAGHSLSTGLQMAGEEIPEPLAGEFRRCYDQHSLGANLEVCMREMAERVGSPDLAFFVTAVLIQRTTGGDLPEVLTNISNMVRSRIRLQQHVKAITAQGRMVGYTLLVLPTIFYIALYAINRKYAEVLIKTKEGYIILCICVVLQLLGLVSIKRIVSVKM